MVDLPPIRIYFHDVKNRLNVISAMAFTGAEILSSLSEQTVSEMVPLLTQTIADFESEYELTQKNFLELLEIIEREVGTDAVLLPAIEQLTSSFKELERIKTELKSLPVSVTNLPILKKSIPLFTHLYDQIHCTNVYLEELKSAIKAIGKYPA